VLGWWPWRALRGRRPSLGRLLVHVLLVASPSLDEVRYRIGGQGGVRPEQAAGCARRRGLM